MPTENQFERTGDGEKRDGRESPNTGSVDRRQLLGIVATTGATALAGCTFGVGSGSDDDDPEADASEDVSGTEDDGANDTESPEDGDESETAGDEVDDPDGDEDETVEDEGDDDLDEDEDEQEAEDEADEDEDEQEAEDEADEDEDEQEADPEPPFSEDCIGVDPTDLAIEEISGGRWRVNSGRSGLLIFDEKDDAETARAVIEHYEFTSFCFVARPDPPMTYWTR